MIRVIYRPDFTFKWWVTSGGDRVGRCFQFHWTARRFAKKLAGKGRAESYYGGVQYVADEF